MIDFRDTVAEVKKRGKLLRRRPDSAAPAARTSARSATSLRTATLPMSIIGAVALSLTAAPADAAEPGRQRDAGVGVVPVSTARISAASALRTTGLAATAARATTHTVVPGDTVSAVAARHGLRTADVLAWNGLTWKSVIRPGQVLRLSPAATAARPAAPAATAAKTHTVRTGDTLWAIAARYGVSVASLLRANKLSGSAIIYPGQSLKVTATPSAQAPAHSAPAHRAPAKSAAPAGKTHTVRAGDTLWAIARTHGISVAALRDLNGLGSASIIRPGQKLKLALAATPAAKRTPAQSSAPARATASSHTVGKGDTLWAIAHKHGTSVSAILAANDLTEASIIYPGQKLALPSRGSLAGLDAEQIANAKLIIQVGRDRGVPDRGIAVALATAMVESWMRNLDWGDRDSLGLFQQRPSQGWGTAAQVRDRARATAVFYGGPRDPNGTATRGLLDIPGWKSMGFAEAAQAVQISAYPDRYAQWEKQAYAWLSALG